VYGYFGLIQYTAGRLWRHVDHETSLAVPDLERLDHVAVWRKPFGDLVLRGRSDALRAFEPLGSQQYQHASMLRYLEAFDKLEHNDPGAIAAFAALVGNRADDLLASFHLKRLLNGATGTRIAMD
jgi:hypothetical protein